MTLIERLRDLTGWHDKHPQAQIGWPNETFREAADMLAEAKRLIGVAAPKQSSNVDERALWYLDAAVWLAKLRGTPERESE